MSVYPLYIGSFRKGPGGAILRCLFDAENGKITVLEKYHTVRPSYLLLDEEKQRLYCIREADEIEGVYGGGVECIDLSGERMVSFSSRSLGGKGPAHLCMRDGWLYTALYGEGGLTQTRVKSGSIDEYVNLIRHTGSGPDRERQEQPHPHFVSFMPDGKHLAVCDLGLDRIFVYSYDPKTGILLEPRLISAPAGSGPRHLVFSRDGRMMYVITEMASDLLTYRLGEDGTAELLDVKHTLPEGYQGENTAAALRMNREGTELAVTDRGHDSMAFFRLGADGIPCFTGRVKTGQWPRDAEFSPDGRWILCANQNEDTVDVYSYDPDTRMDASERVRKADEACLHTDIMPCCIVFGAGK